MKYLNATGQANINDKALFKILSTPALLRRFVQFNSHQVTLLTMELCHVIISHEI